MHKPSPDGALPHLKQHDRRRDAERERKEELGQQAELPRRGAVQSEDDGCVRRMAVQPIEQIQVP